MTQPCKATIWPSSGDRWCTCPGVIVRGRCSVYGTQHDQANAAPMTPTPPADVTGLADDLDRLREAMILALCVDHGHATRQGGLSCRACRRRVDALLSGPLAPLLAEVRRLRAVEEAVKGLASWRTNDDCVPVRDVEAALAAGTDGAA